MSPPASLSTKARQLSKQLKNGVFIGTPDHMSPFIILVHTSVQFLVDCKGISAININFIADVEQGILFYNFPTEHFTVVCLVA